MVRGAFAGTLILLLASFAGASDPSAAGPWALTSGGVTLRIEACAPKPGTFGITLSHADAPGDAFTQPRPLAVEVVDAGGQARWVRASYASVSSAGDRMEARGEAVSAGGTHFVFRDVYSAAGSSGSFLLCREIEVQRQGTGDKGFMSSFSLGFARPTEMTDWEFFAPGIWYRDNAHLRPGALASDYSHEAFLFREDRLPLPVVMMRHRGSGVSAALLHDEAVPTTFFGEDGLDRLIDKRMQCASMGVWRSPSPALALWMPGTEGELTYVMRVSPEKRWALRSHPVVPGAKQAYRILITLARPADYPTAVRDTWRQAYARYRPPLVRAPLELAYRTGVDLLGTYAKPYNGMPGIPFAVALSTGEPNEVSYQMGFVGQQLPAAYHLIRHGLETKSDGFVRQGESIVDFWAKRSPTRSGLPRVWFDVYPRPHWRRYNTYLRIAADGMEGALKAWNIAKRHGLDRPQWRRFCEQFGDWLVEHQNPDGSFYREYTFRGRPAALSTLSTTHPIGFLVDLYLATGRKAYLDAAVRAGEFSLSAVHRGYAYVGGTPDNPDVIDKEAGLLALDSFLALYDATGRAAWLEAAAQAGAFGETWLYAWNVPVPPDDPQADLPKVRTTCGFSLIATGHSGADSAMLGQYAFQYYRLSLYTGDRHFAEVARIILHNTKQTIDLDGSLKYAHPGLQTESFWLSLLRGHTLKAWLPWLTVATLEPLVQLREAFGTMDIDEIEKLPLEERRARNRAWAVRRGFGKP